MGFKDWTIIGMALALLAVFTVNAGLVSALQSAESEREKLAAKVDTLEDKLHYARGTKKLVQATLETARERSAELRRKYEHATSQRAHIEELLVERYDVERGNAERYAPHVVSLSRDYGIDPYLWMQLIHAESNWQSAAKSSVGAIGLGQVWPRIWVRKLDYIKSRKDLYVPHLNLKASADVLSRCMERWGDTRQALGCYHGGVRGATDPRPVTRAYQRSILSEYRSIPGAA